MIIGIDMTIRVPIPPALLEALDRKARVLKISRNGLILRALEKEAAPRPSSDWSPGFFERLSRIEPGVAEGVEDMLASVLGARTSKPPVSL
jgi:hypothetical protein